MNRIFQVFAIVALLCGSVNVEAHDADTTKANIFKRGLDVVKLQKARSLFLANDYGGALEVYRELFQKNQGNPLVNFRMGETYMALRQYRESIPYFEKAVRLEPDIDNNLHFLYGKAWHRIGDLDRALEQFEAYEQVATDKGTKAEKESAAVALAQIKLARKMAIYPVDVVAKPIGAEINSEFMDYAPSLTADGKTMIFTSRRPDTKGGEKDPNNGQYYEDIYISEWDSLENKWGTATPIEGRLNTETHDANLSISPDGEYIYVYKNMAEQGSGEIYYSKKSTSGKWGSPKSMGKPINTSYFESSASVTADGETLYFVSERKGGVGMGDIYVSEKKGREWSEPVNLGPVINTLDDEISVFVHPEGNVLFFSSEGHNTLGGYDIFKSTKVDGKWTAPVNIGFPINTVQDDRHFTLTADFKRAFYSTRPENGFGALDIVEVDLSKYDIVNKNWDFSKIATVEGIVLVAGTSSPVSASIKVTDTASRAVVTETHSTETGRYILELFGNKNYTVEITAEGYKVSSTSLPVPLEASGDTEIQHNFELTPR